MKTLNVLLMMFFIIVTSCNVDKQLDTVSHINVSQGTYIGIVRLNWEPVSEASRYNIERKETNGDWISVASIEETTYDDYGAGFPDNKLVEGAKYSYRISSASDNLDDSPYSNTSDEGWIYEFEPIQLTVTRESDGSISLNWSDPNQELASSNYHVFYYRIKRRYENETEFKDIYTTDHIGTVKDMAYTDGGVAKDKTAYYQIQGVYEYGLDGMIWEHNYDVKKESGGTLQVNYTITQLGNSPRANDGYGFVKLKNINGEMYVATIAKPVFGNPIIYKLNGTSWQSISSNYPEGLLKNYDKISFCGDGTNLWLGGISDSAYVYAYNSGWSGNLAENNFGLTTKPDNFCLEYFGSKLYALIEHDDKLEVFSYAQNSSWNSESVIENSGGIFDLGFKVFNGKLYSYYDVFNSEYNSTLKIKQLEGSNWQTDFEAAYDNLMNVSVNVDNSGVIYFTSDSQEPATWQGNVYKVTSSSTAQELVSSSNTWLTFPHDIDYDDMGNPIVLYYKYISQTTNAEAHLAVYENNEWKEVAGDFSNHIHPADVESNNGLYFIYGDGNDLVSSYPATLKAIKLNH